MRAELQEASEIQPRYVPKEHHDKVTEILAKNTAEIFSSGLVSHLEIYSREAKLFDSKINSPNEIEKTINNELNRLSKDSEKTYDVKFVFNRDLSEKLGKRSFDVIVNDVKVDAASFKDPHLVKALDGLRRLSRCCTTLFYRLRSAHSLLVWICG